MLDPGVVFQPPGLLRSREAITGARSLTANDNGLLLEATSGSGTIDGSAVTLGAGFKFTVYNSGSGSPVFDPASTQTIRLPSGTVSTVTILQGQGLTLVSDGTNWIGVLGIGFAPSPSVSITTDTIQAATTAGILLRNSAGTQVMSVGLTGTGVTFAGAVTANGGTVQIATADINGGAIDGTAIGAASASTGAFTTASFSGLITHSGVNTASGSTASRLVYFGGTSGDGAAFELRGSTFAGSPDTGFFRVGSTYIGNWSTAGLTLTSGALTVASDTDATTILGRARIASPTTDIAHFAHFDQSGATAYALAATSAGATQVNAASGQSITLRVANTTVATQSSTALTLASGINLAMSGASTATFGTGAFSVGGAASFTSTVSGSSTSNSAYIWNIQNTSTGTNADARYRAQNNNSVGISLTSRGGGNTGTIYGITLGNWCDLTVGGASTEGLIIGTISVAKPVVFGVNTTEMLRLTSDSATVQVASGVALRLGNTAVAATPTPTHTITIVDASGTTYRVPCVV